jgi:signal transduction histidine kinase/ligand-binding sensor domain-containing protein/CheY-like chemotaxis protein
LTIYLILNLMCLIPVVDMKKIYVLIILSIGISGNAQVHFEHLTADNGLSDNYIESIYRDSKDYIWIGTTSNGLNRYDGNGMTVYQNTDGQPGEISNNGIRCIFEDSKNNLWVGTYDGLNLYDPGTESFKVFRHGFADSTSANKNSVRCVFEDSKGNLWIAFDRGVGLCKWDYEKKSFIRYQINKCLGNYIKANSITSVQEDLKGNLWIAARGPGIYQFQPKTGSFVAYNDPNVDLGKNHRKKIYIDRNDKIWIGSLGKGLFLFNPSTCGFKHYGINNGNKGLNSQLVTDVIQKDRQHLLIATDQGGINIFNMVSNTFEYIVQDETIKHGLNNNGILCLHQDKEGILWAGTSRGGVNYFNPKLYKFNLVEHNNKNPNSLSYGIVGCFYEDSKGLIWIGTDGGGVNVYNPKSGRYKVFKHNPSDPYSISGDVIRCIAEDNNNDMWIGTWDAGLNRYDNKTKKFYHYFSNPKDSSSILTNTIWNLKIDHRNKIWLSNYSHGLEIFDVKKEVVKRFSANPGDPRALCNNEVTLIYEDLYQNIWICSREGVSLYDSVTNSFTVYKNFPSNNIVSFCRDKEGKLWAGSIDKGLFLFKPDGTIVKTYTKSDGLPDNTIQAIVEDNHGNLWMSTNNGISRFNQKKQKFKNYSKSDGLQGNLFFEQSFLKTRSGEIYFGGYNGFNSFHPDSLKDNGYVPKVYITDFLLFNKPVPFGIPGSPLQNHISKTDKITLTWRESVFSFEFNAINYTHPEKNKYAYKMDGFEKDWNYTDATRRYVTYTNLNPGKYTFMVRASNNDGAWNKEGASVKIIILPPWWDTWWFRILAVFVILFSIFGLFIYRTSQLKKQKILLAQMVKERTFQLEETNTILEEKQEEIYIQNEELQCQKEALQETNRTLEEQAEEIKNQKNELDQHRNHLEKLVKERTADLVTAMKKVEESNRLKSAFLANMSHEIRTPMNAIVGFSSLLSDPDLSDAEKNLFSTYIKTNSEALLVQIDDILEMSQIQANQLVINNQPVNVIEIIMELLASFQLQAKPKGIDLILEDGNFSDTLICHVDPIRLKQVFSNLLGNSIKFTEKGFVKFGIDNLTDSIITFYVKDTGIGIPLEAKDSIFEYFLKVESPETKLYDGIGLGLSISHSLIKAMGGDIWYESEIGKGTTFYFSLPRTNDNDLVRSKSEGGREIPNLEDKKILVVEDDETNYRLLEYYLTKTKAESTWAKNGLEALENVKGNNSFDLILMDLKLPVMSGIEATMNIRRIKPEQIIVAQTAFTNKEERKEFLKCKFNGFIEKPIIMQTLFETINEVFKK